MYGIIVVQHYRRQLLWEDVIMENFHELLWEDVIMENFHESYIIFLMSQYIPFIPSESDIMG